MTALEKASLFWEYARQHVLAVAEIAGLHIELDEHDDQFLYDLYDYGDFTPTDEEIIAAIEEVALNDYQ